MLHNTFLSIYLVSIFFVNFFYLFIYMNLNSSIKNECSYFFICYDDHTQIYMLKPIETL